MDVRQCKKCNKLFQYVGKPLCPACTSEMDQIFTTVRDYIYSHPTASIDQICEETGVEPSDIRRWLADGRLIVSTASTPLLQCEKCGAPIYTGKLCDSCTNKMRSVLQNAAGSMRPAAPAQSNPAPAPRKDSGGRMHGGGRK